jgi:hypothetical protein
VPANHVLLRSKLALQGLDAQDLGIDPLQLEPGLPALDADQKLAPGRRDRRPPPPSP